MDRFSFGSNFQFFPIQGPGGIVPGATVEAEWVPGRWHRGQVVEAGPGALTIQYDDGYLQRNVPLAKVRPVPAGAGPATPVGTGASWSGSAAHRPGVPPPPPPAAYPWPEESGNQRVDPSAGLDLPRLKLQPRGAPPNAPNPPGETIEPSKEGFEEEDPGTRKARRRLSAAVEKGSTKEVEELLLEAQRMGMQGSEVRWARDTLLAAEAADFRKKTLSLVEDAIESLDYWKLQAAMQAVIGCGLGKDQAPRLKQAMRTHKLRSEAARELRKAAQARDKARLRTAIESALKVHTEEAVVKKARDALRTLQARETARDELRKATVSKEPAKLKVAIAAAEKVGLHEEAPGMLGEDPKEQEELGAARQELRQHAMARLSKLADSEDVENFAKGLEELADHGVPKQEWQQFKKRHSQLKIRQGCQTKLALATKARNKEQILLAMKEAKENSVEEDCEVMEIARQTLSILEAEETMAKTRADVAEELSKAVQGEDQRRLLAAITAADAAGFTSSEVGFARERLRRLRARVGAAQELREAAHSADLYRLRAAITAAKRAEVSEAEIAGGKEALRCLELQADVRRSIEAAVTAKDADLLRHCIEEGKKSGLNRQEVAKAQKLLHKLGQSSVGRELSEALKTGDTVRLRAAARAATDAGMNGGEVDSAWHRLRELESHSWLRQQLDSAAASNDAVRLQAAIKQAELGGLAMADLLPAKRHLDALNARLHARQELHLAKTSGNPYALLAAVRQGEEAGLPHHELDSARRGTEALGQIEIAPETDFFAPATQPQLQTILLEQPPTVLGTLQQPTQPQLHPTTDSSSWLDGGWLTSFRTRELAPPVTQPAMSQTSWAAMQPAPDSPISMGFATAFPTSTSAKQAFGTHWTLS